MVERTRISDKIFIAHGIKIVDLQRAIVDYELENDEEYKQMVIKFKQERMMEELQLSDAQREQVSKMCSEAGQVCVNLDADGLLDFEQYFAIFRIIVRLQVRFAKLIDDEFKAERRAALAAKNMQQFSQTT